MNDINWPVLDKMLRASSASRALPIILALGHILPHGKDLNVSGRLLEDSGFRGRMALEPANNQLGTHEGYNSSQFCAVDLTARPALDREMERREEPQQEP